MPSANDSPVARSRSGRGIPIRALVPNMVTALALCTGLSGVWFAIAGRWELAVAAILVAGVFDGLDGRIARLLKGQSRFGAELDSLSDVIAFGVTPGLVLFLWSLQYMPRFGWTIALFYTLCCALRLARFNAQIEAAEQPHKAAGYLTGVPAPAGAGIALMPVFAWLVTGWDEARHYALVAPWLLAAALLMLSTIASYSWTSFRIRRHVRIEAIALAGLLCAALISDPWLTLLAISALYLLTLPFSLLGYRRVRRRLRAAGQERPNEAAQHPDNA